jgi:integrase
MSAITARAIAAAAARHDAWLAASGLADRTKATYRQQARGYLAWLLANPRYARWLTADRAAAVEDVDLAQAAADRAARAWHRHLISTGTSPASIKLALAALRSLNAAHDLDPPAIDGRPTTRPYQAPDTLGPRQVGAITAAAGHRGERDRALVELAAQCGLRPGELAALEIGDLGAEACAITVRSTIFPHRTRTLALPARTQRALLAWIRSPSRGAGSSAIFPGRSGGLAVRTIRHVITQAGADAGITTSPMSLRHTRAQRLAATTSPHEAAAQLGHARAETLRRYLPPVRQAGPDPSPPATT